MFYKTSLETLTTRKEMLPLKNLKLEHYCCFYFGTNEDNNKIKAKNVQVY